MNSASGLVFFVDFTILFLGLWVYAVTRPDPNAKLVWYKELWFMFGWVIIPVAITSACVFVNSFITI